MKAEEYKVVVEFVHAEQAMHKLYGSTSTCYGGVGGQMVTTHCVHTCHNHGAHQAEEQRYHDAKVAVLQLRVDDGPGVSVD